MIISINKDGNLHYKSHEKPMNLHQHLSPASNHPPNTLQGLVFGMLQSYWEQNSWVSDFEKIASKFALRLMSWGYSLQSTTPLFEEKIEKLQQQHELTPTDRINKDNSATRDLCTHTTFHKCGVDRRTVRKMDGKTLGPELPNRNLVVAQS